MITSLGGENISGGDTGTVEIEVAGVVSPHKYADEMRRWHLLEQANIREKRKE